MKIISTRLKGVYCVEMQPAEDKRGWFGRFFCKKEFAALGFQKEWVQMNQTFTKKTGTIRGMHFQFPPFAETKLVRCIRGRIADVVIDLRKDSDTFLQWETFELSDLNWRAVFIPEGFAHGFQTLEDNCELIYCHSNFFTKDGEGAIRFNDPMLAIRWPLPLTEISERDQNHPYLTKDFIGLTIP